MRSQILNHSPSEGRWQGNLGCCARLWPRKSFCLCAIVVGWMPSDVLRSRVIVCIKGVQSVPLSEYTLLCTATYEVMATHCNPCIGLTSPNWVNGKVPKWQWLRSIHYTPLSQKRSSLRALTAHSGGVFFQRSSFKTIFGSFSYCRCSGSNWKSFSD